MHGGGRRWYNALGMRPSATIVIPCRDAESTLPAALRAVRALDGADGLVVVVADNGSTDASVQIAREFADLVVRAETPGVSHARNAGLERVETSLMLSLDADCVPQRDWARHHLEVMDAASPDTLGTAGRTVPEPSPDRWQVRADVTPHPAFDITGRPMYAVAGNACYRTHALRRLGGFPRMERIDAALGHVASEAGLVFAWCPDAVVTHRNRSGWRGYAIQVAKIGAYAAEINGRPANLSRWYLSQLGRLLRSPAAIRWGAHEALAEATRAVAVPVGARRAWRSDDTQPPAAEYAARRVSGLILGAGAHRRTNPTTRHRG